MRKRVMVRDEAGFHAIWVDEGPDRAAMGHHRGELVVGVSEAAQERLTKKRYDAKKAAA